MMKIPLEKPTIVDIGPNAGRLGGEIIHNGSYKSLLKNKNPSLGNTYLEKRTLNYPTKAKKFKKMIKLTGATKNNLNNVSISIPLGILTYATGVSGSGKTLIKDTLLPMLNKNQSKAKHTSHIL